MIARLNQIQISEPSEEEGKSQVLLGFIVYDTFIRPIKFLWQHLPLAN